MSVFMRVGELVSDWRGGGNKIPWIRGGVRDDEQ